MAGVGEDTDTDGSVIIWPSLSHVSKGGGDDCAMQDCWKVSPSKISRASIRGIIRGRSASVKVLMVLLGRAIFLVAVLNNENMKSKDVSCNTRYTTGRLMLRK